MTLYLLRKPELLMSSFNTINFNDYLHEYIFILKCCLELCNKTGKIFIHEDPLAMDKID